MQKAYILAADDDPDDRMVMEHIFTQTACPAGLVFVNDGDEAVRFLASHSTDLPRLVITDLNMPRVGGAQLLRILKQDSLYAGIPVIVFTTSGRPEDARDCYAAGAAGYIVKPGSLGEWRRIAEEIYGVWLGTVKS